MTILDELAKYAQFRVAQAEKALPLSALRKDAEALPKGEFAFEKALKKPDIAFICECKKASPSKGLISPDFPYLQIAKDYEDAGADCISVLTEPKWFLGSDKYLQEIAKAVTLPVLRKDFTISPYMIYEAKILGAAAVLLICSILDKAQLEEYISLCDGLGLSALVEAHDKTEVETALEVGARIIGVNNRDLKDFSVDASNCTRLRAYVPSDVIFVAESGIRSAEDIAILRKAGVDAALIGETLMRAEDKKSQLAHLRGGV